MMISDKTHKIRQKCYRCLRPFHYCVCKLFPACVQNAMRPIIILQHEKERLHPFNTAKLCEFGLSHCEVLIFKEKQCHADLIKRLVQLSPVLIFPHERAIDLDSVALEGDASILSPQQPLLFIDATWKKAKRIFYTLDILQTRPILSIQAQAASQYRVRKSSFSHSFSTVEAVVEALARTDPGLPTDILSQAFDAMIEQQLVNHPH